MNKDKVSVLFVCMGNICRSPTAEGVFRHTVKQRNLLDSIDIDSAGTHAYHIGEQPDSRSQKTALSKGIDLSSQTARKAVVEDFNGFDYIIAMDRSNYENLKHLGEQSEYDRKAKLHLFMEFTSVWDNDEVPDPYYGGDNGFDQVFDMVQAAAEGLLEHIIKNDL
ncbi:low molecular weight protein-tyrosine-phosphatase [uncultured Cocleimonas sp.]|uniref:low molecular weight protein-tyrosine-phosphatase n=1 Tax=uncultured Cocleimonas sp. TaxID=1051587 RepID=UPI002621AA58|nr:low molecular weight protein-tyrosine-phosphatase [uncultured Cocleimonas sp.]